MSFWGKLIVSYLTKLRVVFINQVTDCKLLKIESYRHPIFGGIKKKPYLCTRHSETSPPQPVRERLFWDVSHRAEPLSRLHLSPSKGIYFFILKFCFMLNNSS